MLLGQYSSRVDAKGRVALPKKLREQLGERIIITRGYEHSLLCVSESNWEELIAGTGDKPFIIGSQRDTNRFLLGSASLIELDSQGRFVIPPYLRNFANVTDESIFLGLGRYAEVWAKTEWKMYQEYLTKNSTTIAKDLGKLQVK